MIFEGSSKNICRKIWVDSPCPNRTHPLHRSQKWNGNRTWNEGANLATLDAFFQLSDLKNPGGVRKVEFLDTNRHLWSDPDSSASCSSVSASGSSDNYLFQKISNISGFFTLPKKDSFWHTRVVFNHWYPKQNHQIGWFFRWHLIQRANSKSLDGDIDPRHRTIQTGGGIFQNWVLWKFSLFFIFVPGFLRMFQQATISIISKQTRIRWSRLLTLPQNGDWIVQHPTNSCVPETRMLGKYWCILYVSFWYRDNFMHVQKDRNWSEIKEYILEIRKSR